jgi:uracil-DNA glycosylase
MTRAKVAVQTKLDDHVTRLRGCTICPKMHRPAVSGGAVWSRVISVGQAPGTKEPVLGRPFAWTAGKTLFGWFHRACGLSEAEFRAAIYMAAVCRCFPGKNAAGGDRVPDAQEIANCSRWLEDEIALLRPALVIPIGKLAILQFIAFDKLTEVIGGKFPVTWRGHRFDVVPLPHPSGASPWHRMEPGKTLLDRALRAIVTHPAWPQHGEARFQPPSETNAQR